MDFYLLTFLFLEALNVSYPLKTSQINEQTRKYKTHLKELKSEPNWDNNKVARYAWHYCAINYINQLGRIIPYDITGCIDILKWYVSCHHPVICLLCSIAPFSIHEFLRLILRSTDHEYQALREMDNKVRAEISRIEKLEQDLWCVG